MKAIERLYQYIEYKGVKPVPFEKIVGLSNGYLGKQLRRNANLGEEVLCKIIDNCPDINPVWLLTGVGEMLKKEEESEPAFPQDGCVSKELYDDLLSKYSNLQEEVGALKYQLKEANAKLIQKPSRSVTKPRPKNIKTP